MLLIKVLKINHASVLNLLVATIIYKLYFKIYCQNINSKKNVNRFSFKLLKQSIRT